MSCAWGSAASGRPVVALHLVLASATAPHVRRQRGTLRGVCRRSAHAASECTDAWRADANRTGVKPQAALPLTMGMANRWMDWSLASHLQPGCSKAAGAKPIRGARARTCTCVPAAQVGGSSSSRRSIHSSWQPARSTCTCGVCHHTCSWSYRHSRHSQQHMLSPVWLPRLRLVAGAGDAVIVNPHNALRIAVDHLRTQGVESTRECAAAE